MSETRVYTSPDNILHIAEVATRRSRNSVLRFVLILLFAIPVLVGFFDLLNRAIVFFDIAHASGSLEAVQGEDLMASASSSFEPTTLSAGIVPARLEIPAIGVKASVEKVGLNAADAMQAPSGFAIVGWYSAGVMPGGSGSAVIDGHVNNALTKAGVFEHLDHLQAGDKILVANAAGNRLTFEVTAIKKYPVDAAPEAEIFSRVGPPQLILITCDGIWDNAKHEYTDRLVVYASLIQPI